MNRTTAPVEEALPDERLAIAVQRGLISPETAQAIASIEVDGDGAPGGSRLTPLVAEAVGFVGAALALVAAVLLVSQFWADLRPWARVALPLVAAIALLAAGAWLRAREVGAVARLASFLWLLSVASFAFAVSLVGEDILDLHSERTALLAGGVSTVYAGALWFVRRRALQQIAVFVALLVTMASGLDLVDPQLTDYAGLLLWAVGIAWLLLAWGEVVQPRTTAFALGGIAAVIGPLMTTFAMRQGGLALGLVTAISLVVVSVTLRRTVLLWLGVVAMFIYIPQIVFEFFGETLGAPLALFITGVVLVGVALGVARLHTSIPPGPGTAEGER
jgi:hypothetical protein